MAETTETDDERLKRELEEFDEFVRSFDLPSVAWLRNWRLDHIDHDEQTRLLAKRGRPALN